MWRTRTVAKTRLQQQVPIIIEPHPEEYEGYPFITLFQYKQDHILTIVDNSTDKKVSALVLDFCGPEHVDEQFVIDIASEWYKAGSPYPISIEFSKRGFSGVVNRLFKAFEMEFITRVIGPLPRFEMETEQTKRRRKRSVPKSAAKNQTSDIFIGVIDQQSLDK